MRILLILTLLLVVGCQKSEPQPSSGRSFDSERLKTLTHDTDLIAPKPEAGENDLRAIGESLRGDASPSSAAQ